MSSHQISQPLIVTTMDQVFHFYIYRSIYVTMFTIWSFVSLVAQIRGNIYIPQTKLIYTVDVGYPNFIGMQQTVGFTREQKINWNSYFLLKYVEKSFLLFQKNLNSRFQKFSTCFNLILGRCLNPFNFIQRNKISTGCKTGRFKIYTILPNNFGIYNSNFSSVCTWLFATWCVILKLTIRYYLYLLTYLDITHQSYIFNQFYVANWINLILLSSRFSCQIWAYSAMENF